MKHALIALGLLASQTLTAGPETLGKEPLRGYRIKSNGIEFFVASGGCTSKKNFELKAEGKHPIAIHLERIVPDHCEALIPNGQAVEYTWEEIGLRQGRSFIISNEHTIYAVP